MVKILIGNRNSQEFPSLCPKLTNDKNYKIENITTGGEVLSAYSSLKPDVLVLDNNLRDVPMEEIIDRLSYNPKEQKKCNTVLTVSRNYFMKLTNVSMVYKILYKPIDSELTDVIEQMAINLNTPDLDTEDVEWLLASLHFNCLSTRV